MHSVTASHTFSSPGVYFVTLTVAGGGARQRHREHRGWIERDGGYLRSNGGFVTGGGWINSPAGAFQPAHTPGKANSGSSPSIRKMALRLLAKQSSNSVGT